MKVFEIRESWHSWKARAGVGEELPEFRILRFQKTCFHNNTLPEFCAMKNDAYGPPHNKGRSNLQK